MLDLFVARYKKVACLSDNSFMLHNLFMLENLV